ncbi:hypothetical protein Tsubulata_048321, partial [Turnera subulata]
KNRTFWRVLKIDRCEPSELNIVEDPTSYSETELCDLLRRIYEGNKATGGMKFVSICYGIFLGPYYMLLITKRRKIGAICGHPIYAIMKSEMIPIAHSSVRSNMAYSKNENRYKKLLCTVDLTRDFFFSYSYHVMHSLQKNLCGIGTGLVHYETMFVWNEFLTRGIRNNLKNTLMRQRVYTDSDCQKITTLRWYQGRVANDVETEQIVFEKVPDGGPVQISSVVQNRGSIPLFWSQETSKLNIKPDIICIGRTTLTRQQGSILRIL